MPSATRKTNANSGMAVSAPANPNRCLNTSADRPSAAKKDSTTYEWTYIPATSHLSPRPTGWCLRGTSTCAQFFGGITSNDANAVMWQWSGGGGTSNGVGDFDQIDLLRTP